jgi:Pectate lyase superfamily protein
MALQTINIGASANDGSGDPLRTAMDKINDNFLLANINVFNVKDPAYGAVGDGVTDDTAAIQACINAMRSAISTSLIASGATFGITFPAGIYLVTDSLDFTNIECLNWTIQGNSSVIYARCAGKPVLDMLDAHRINIYDLNIGFDHRIGHFRPLRIIGAPPTPFSSIS